MSEITQQELPEVDLTSTFDLQQRKVARFLCSRCGRCALVPVNQVGTVEQDTALAYGGLCEGAIAAAAIRYR